MFREQGGFFGGGDSSSVTRIDNRRSDSRIGAADGSVVLRGSGTKSSTTYAPVNNYIDPGAFALVGKLIDSQSGVTTGSLSFAAQTQAQLAELAETKVTDGANLNQKTTLIALAVLGALAVVFMLIRRH